jgi:outer membrane protein TolC
MNPVLRNRRNLRRHLAVIGTAMLIAGCSSAPSGSVARTAQLSSPVQSTAQLAAHSTSSIQQTAAITSEDGESGLSDTSQLIHVVEDTIRLNQVESQSTEREESPVPILAASVGAPLPRDANTEPDAFRDLTESEMLSLAMVNSPVLRPLGLRVLDNPQAATTVFDSAIAATDPFFGPQAALAEFDTNLSASINTQNNDRVFNNTTLGGDVQELVQDLVSMNTGAQRRTRSGALLELNGTTGYDNNNRAGNIFPNYWETQLEAGIRQPLMQGAGRQFNEIAGPNAQPGFNFSNGIIIARLNNKITDADFEIQVRSFVRDLYIAYWDLSRQYQAYDSVVEARDLAYDTWQSILAKKQAKLSGGEAHREAQARARYYNFRRQVQIALGGQNGQGGLYVAERRLRQLVGVQIVDGELLRPIDQPVDVRFVFDYDKLISRAMVDRSEIRQQGLRIEQQRLRLIAAKNFMLPQLDLIGRYRLRGFGDDLTGSGPRFSSAAQDFWSFDHQEWEFGVEMGVVHGRRQARAAISNATLQLNRERAILAEQQRSLRHEVSDAYAEVSSSFAAMESSLEQVEASRERLESSAALYRADKIQLEFLLDAQSELLTAEQQLATDQSRYAVSLIAINATTGSLLTDLGVLIQKTSCRSNVIYLQEIESSGENLHLSADLR